jgi:hypothetical protein
MFCTKLRIAIKGASLGKEELGFGIDEDQKPDNFQILPRTAT